MALLAAAVTVAAVVDLPTAVQLRDLVAAAGPGAPLLFVLLYALVTLAPVPKNVLSAAAGLLFGLFWGIGLVLVAALLGATVAFGLGRLLGREAVERLTRTGTGTVARVDALLARRGLPAVVAVRLVPLVPFTAVNYAAGLTGLRVRDYLLGTAVGIVPGTVAFVTLGSYGTRPGSWPFLAAAAGLLLLTAAGTVLARRRRTAGRRGRD